MTREELLPRLRLVAVTNRLLVSRSLEDCARELAAGGTTAIMLREKDLTVRGLYEIARMLRPVCAQCGVLFLVNSSIETALAVEADGAHLGEQSLPPEAARRIAPPGFVLGFSAHNAGEVARAAEAGMDYVTASPVFTPTSKEMRSPPLGLAGLRRLAEASPVPVVALGGVTPANAADCLAAGAVGVAAIGSLFGSTSPRRAAEDFRRGLEAGAA